MAHRPAKVYTGSGWDDIGDTRLLTHTHNGTDGAAIAEIPQSKVTNLVTDLANKVTTPSGGSDGQALVKSGGSVVWGTGGLPYYVGVTAPSTPTAFYQWLDTSASPTVVWKMWNGAKWVVVNTSSTSLIPNVGDAAYEGYMAGIVDTTRAGSIVGTDYYQTGAKYLLIIAPKSLEYTTGLRWKTTNDAGPAQTRTRWNGLGATEAMKNAGTNYEAGTYCYNLSYNTTDGGSRWYLPALDELEILYRAFKPTTEANNTSFWTSGAGTFPYNGGTVPFGYNISSDPTGSNYSSGSPAQTSLAAFKSGGAQAFEGATNPYYWASSEYDASYGWGQLVGGTYAGYQDDNFKNATLIRVRPVRRVVL